VFCSNCGKKLADDSKFCPKCGTKVEEIEDSQFDDEDLDDEDEDLDEDDEDEDGEEDNGNAVLYMARGMQYFDNGEFDNAIDNFSKAIQLGKRLGFDEKMLQQLGINNGVNKNEMLASVYYIRGLAYNEKIRWDLAMADFNKAIQLAPDSHECAGAYCERGELYRKEKKYDKAIEDCTRAIELSPKWHRAYSQRSYMYYWNNDMDNAIADSTKAIELSPNNEKKFDNYCTRAMLYEHKGDYRRAFTEWNNMLLMFKPDPDGEDGRFLRIMGNLQNCRDKM